VHSLDPTSTPVKSWQHASTLVELGDSTAAALAHSGETNNIFSALKALNSALSTYINAIQPIVEPGAPPHPITDAMTKLVTGAIPIANLSIDTNEPTLPTTIVKGT
jgi:hypothetical protein